MIRLNSLRRTCVLLGWTVILGLSACEVLPNPTPNPSNSPIAFVATTSASTPTLSPAPPTAKETLQYQASPTSLETRTLPLTACSPLDGLGLSEIPASVSNPYHPPAAGKDDPHAGIDLAVRSPDTQVALKGRGVQAVLQGVVAGVIQDRFPFGNAAIIETRLADLPPASLARLALPEAAPPFSGPTALTCPKSATPPAWNQLERSIYLLYAHLQAEPVVKPGDAVTCGQALGAVGDTGNALNPHLHLEARVGPSGWTFSSLAHYDNSASLEEMSTYCAWSVSGIFQVFDPLTLFLEQ